MPKSRDLNIDKTIFDVVGNVRSPNLEPETGWWKIGETELQEIPFENGWGNYDDVEEAPLAYYLSHHGEVRCRGVIDGGAVGDVVFVFPEEARPETRQRYTCSIVGGGFANVIVEPDGSLIVVDIN